MKIDIKILKEQFDNIKTTYNLNWKNVSEYGGFLENNKIEITIITERWEEGVTVAITNKEKNEFYYLDDLFAKKGFSNYTEYLTENEKNIEKELTENHAIIFNFRVFLEKYCTDVLSGDFSKIGSGKSNF